MTMHDSKPLPLAELAPLTEERMADGLRELAARDADLARIFTALGPPPLWRREPGFPTLVRIILEQQVSLASAKAAYERLLAAVSPLAPAAFLQLDDRALHRIGFSRQKAAYCRDLARTIVQGHADLNALAVMDDDTVRRTLTGMKGIGPWTAEIYLLLALRRPDAWPLHDIALAGAIQQVKQLPARPTPSEMDAIGAAWRPWRAVAARLLWHHYLSQRAPGTDFRNL
jgi:DNA-3-methyladenine glycosylase II